MLEVTDDSGFLALLDPDAYRGFVAEEWTLEQLLVHFHAEMAARRLLLWGTGLEGSWRVEHSTAHSARRGFRQVAGPIVSSAGRLLLTNYESLTMAAGFREVTLPEEHDRDLLVPVAPGEHACRVLQMFDPDEAAMARGEGPDFVVEVDAGATPPPPWRAIPWREVPWG